MKQTALDIIKLGKTHDDETTRYQRSNEDRLNSNFRKLLEAVEELQKRVEQLENP